MNRATKRLMAKQEAAAERERARQIPIAGKTPKPGRGGDGAGGEREGRIVRARRFLREVRVELKKVAWPSRPEIVTYTVVVLVSVTFVTLLVFGLDLGFGKAVVHVFK